ncbi:hypothetical protein A1O1_09191 [Capronia coronata CBS 617.96]|uniref:DUF4211 domain-containing protein n=1 Tax=Capronia coronata CBS 617.96 TaxID=1182541 RepID=W9Y8R5_9EURO|nr:uncharacterized protein A1O1_09191 [Capronia coronata CBS 617.96]EXJ78789.1 hypothetical protein A1O1_09191 [Capronia coronata CBS 617.96]
MAGRTGVGVPRRSVRNQKKQTTLQFSPLPSSSPAKAAYSPAVQGRLATVRYGGSRQSSPIPRKDGEDHSAEAATLPTPEPSSQVEDSYQGMLSNGILSGTKSYSGLQASRTPSQTSLPSSPLRARSPKVYKDISDDEDDDDDLVSSAKKRRRLTPRISVAEGPVSTRCKQSTRLQSNSASHPTYSTRSGQEQSAVSDFGSPESSGDEDVVMASKPAARRRQPKAVQHDDPFIVNDDEIQYISDEDTQEAPPMRSQKPRGNGFVVADDEVEFISSDDATEHNVQQRPKSHRLSASHKSPHKRRKSRREQEELDEDLKDLQDSEQEHVGAQTRTRGGPVTTQRDKLREHLDLLRRRRAGERAPRVLDSEDEEEEEEKDEDEAVDLDLIGHPDHEFASEGSAHSSLDTDRESQGGQPQEDEDDFIVEDATGRLGRPHPDIPLAFTSFASAKPRELFPHIIEWLVKNKIAPAFARDDELYNLAFNRIDDQVKAQAGSRLISSAWGVDFKKAILARPNMKVEALPGDDADNIRDCDACNRSGHPARYEFVLSGQPYFKKTLEPVDNSDDDEENYDDDDASRDEDGYVLPPENRRFYLGRFCAANAEMGHKLTHWKYHLNETLMSYLEEQGVLSAEAIITRDKMNKKKREKEAENIVDNMEQTGVIGGFWADFENDLKDARLGMEDYDRKGGRSKGRVGAIRAKGNGLIREWGGDKYHVTKAVDSDSD